MARILVLAALALVLVPLGVRLGAHVWAGQRTASATELESGDVAVVFGAGVRNGYPTAMLQDRVATAAALYRAGKVRALLLSGDGRMDDMGEPASMRRAALQLGVPDGAIVLDPGGLSTYDTCFRARAVFGVLQPVLVTQSFHLDRALLTCRMLGIQAMGVPADQRDYRNVWWNQAREVPATLNALFETLILRPNPSAAK